jgi:hypothetical protein
MAAMAITMPLHAQDDAATKAASAIGGNLGVTFIDGQPYYLLNLTPDVAFGKFGVGLDVNLRFTTDGKVDTDDLTAARMIRYLRYGSKGDGFYGRVGLLDYARLGNGFILGNYKNTASYELRRVGFELDLAGEKMGLETVMSDVGEPSVLGLRAHVRPLRFTAAENIPILSNLIVGATFATDLHPNANITSVSDIGVPSTRPGSFMTTDGVDGGSLSAYGVDIGLPIFERSWLRTNLYADYAQIVDFGSGAALGFDFRFRPFGLIDLGIQLERRYLGDQFLPRYFDGLYERTRYTPLSETVVATKAQELLDAKATQGNYGEITLTLFGGLTVNGQYYSPVGVKNAGDFHARVMPGFEIPGGFEFDAGMDRRRIGKLFALDENTTLFARFGYKMNRFVVASMLYQYTYAPVKNAQGQTIRFKQQVRVEPRIGVVARF